MRKILLLSIFSVSALSVFAQTGSTVREDRIWNYSWDTHFTNPFGKLTYSNPDRGYHFDGEESVNGKVYAVFRDGKGEKQDLLRQEDGKVYLYTKGSSILEILTEDGSKETEDEVLLYDFDALPGDTIHGVGFDDLTATMGVTTTLVVKENTTLQAGGREFRCQTLYEAEKEETLYTAVEGVGFEVGLLSRPQYANFNLGLKRTMAILDSATDSDGENLFSYYDINPRGTFVNPEFVWNYVVEKREGGNILSSEPANGYYFAGETRVAGRPYLQFRNGSGEVGALMRQVRDKVYLHLDENMKELMGNLSISSGHPADEVSGSATEVLLYDLGLESGESYPSITYINPMSDEFVLSDVDVKSLLVQHVSDLDFKAQLLDCDVSIVEHAGMNRGFLHKPQMQLPETLSEQIVVRLESLGLRDFGDIYHGDDFPDYKDREDFGSTVREDRVWIYRAEVSQGDKVGYEYHMRFDGVTEIDGKTYHNLNTVKAVGYSYEGSGSTPTEIEIPERLTFLMREDDGRIYRHAPLPSSPESDYMGWNVSDGEALVYDFNLSEGDAVSVVDSFGQPVGGKVTSVSVLEISGEECKAYTMLLDGSGLEYEIIEGIGVTTIGCLPYIQTDMVAGGTIPGYAPTADARQSLYQVTDLDGNVIYQSDKCLDWPWVGVETATRDDFSIEYRDSMISVRGGQSSASEIIISDMSGKMVARGENTVSTSSLQPGVYVAKSGGSIQKIVVR